MAQVAGLVAAAVQVAGRAVAVQVASSAVVAPQGVSLVGEVASGTAELCSRGMRARRMSTGCTRLDTRAPMDPL